MHHALRRGFGARREDHLAERGRIGRRQEARRLAPEHALPEVATAAHDDVAAQRVDVAHELGRERGVVEAAELVRREQQLRSRGAEDVVQLVRSVVRQQRVEHRTEREHAEVDGHRLVPVRQLHRHHVTRSHALLFEEAGHPARVVPQLLVRRARIGGLVDDRDRLRLRARVLAHAVDERGAVPPPVGDVLLRARSSLTTDVTTLSRFVKYQIG